MTTREAIASKNLLTTGWIFCVCDSGKKVGLGLGNLPAQGVQPVKTCVTTLMGLIFALLANFNYFLQLSCLLLRLGKLRVAAVLAKISEQLVLLRAFCKISLSVM